MNRINNKTLVLIIVVLLAANLVLIFMLKNPAETGKRNRGNRNPADYFKKELQLSADQASRFSELYENHSASNKMLYDLLRERRIALYEHLKQVDQPDSIAGVLSDSIAAIEKQLVLNNYTHFTQLRKICDPGQQTKLDSLVHRMGNRRR